MFRFIAFRRLVATLGVAAALTAATMVLSERPSAAKVFPTMAMRAGYAPTQTV